MKKCLFALMLLSLLGAVQAGCSKKEHEQLPAGAGRTLATPDYESYFGAPPPCDKGVAYSFVIYFPSGRAPGKVVPFPFFTFDQASMAKVAVQRLLNGMDLGSYRGEFPPLPSGSRLVSLSEERGTITADFSRELGMAPASVATALALTLRQFKGVSAVRLLLEGRESNFTALAQKADKAAVWQPAPRLLTLTAMRNKGASQIEEVNAFFDRPVEVKELALIAESGEQFPGEIYHSVFDMAAVLKPKDPSQFKKDMPVRVRWKVVDKLGRQAEGDSVWPLEVREH